MKIHNSNLRYTVDMICIHICVPEDNLPLTLNIVIL